MLHTPNPMAITSTEEIKVATFQLNCAGGGDEYHKFVYRIYAFTFGCPNMHIRKFAKNVYHKLNLSKKWHVAQMQIWIEYAVCIYICKRRIYPANTVIEQRQMRISAVLWSVTQWFMCISEPEHWTASVYHKMLKEGVETTHCTGVHPV